MIDSGRTNHDWHIPSEDPKELNEPAAKCLIKFFCLLTRSNNGRLKTSIISSIYFERCLLINSWLLLILGESA